MSIEKQQSNHDNESVVGQFDESKTGRDMLNNTWVAIFMISYRRDDMSIGDQRVLYMAVAWIVVDGDRPSGRRARVTNGCLAGLVEGFERTRQNLERERAGEHLQHG